MSWIRIDDQMPDHPKFAALGAWAPFAVALQLRALCYSARYLTDGFLPAAVVPQLLQGFAEWSIETGGVPGIMGVGESATDTDWPALMVGRGLWDQCKDGFKIHDYLGYNPTRLSVMRDRQSNKQRQQRFRQRNAKDNVVTNGPVTGAPYPNPYPYPTTTTTPPTTQLPKGRRASEQHVAPELAAAFDRFWLAYPSRSPATNPKKPALRAFTKLVESGEDPEHLIHQATAYALYCRTTMRPFRFILQAASFLGEKEAWRVDYTPNWNWLSEVDDPINKELTSENLAKLLNDPNDEGPR